MSLVCILIFSSFFSPFFSSIISFNFFHKLFHISIHKFIRHYCCIVESSGLRVCNREVAVDFSMGRLVYQKIQDEKESKKLEENAGVIDTDFDFENTENKNENEEEEEEEEEGEEEEEEENDVDDVVKGCTVFIRYVTLSQYFSNPFKSQSQ